MSSCVYCDPGFLVDECRPSSCFATLLAVVVLFVPPLIYSALTLVLLYKKEKKIMGTSQAATLLCFVMCALRITKYAILLASDRNVSMNQSLFLFTEVIYAFALIIGMFATAVIIYLWIFVYHKIVLRAKTNLHVSTKDVHGTWFRWFLLIYGIFGGGYVVFFVLEQVLKNYIISGAYLAVFVIVQCIFLIVYGRRINKVIEAQKQKEGKLKKFHKMKVFTLTTGIVWVIAVVAIASFTAGTLFIITWEFFLVRLFTFRLIELTLLILLTRCVQPRLAYLWKANLEATTAGSGADSKANLQDSLRSIAIRDSVSPGRDSVDLPVVKKAEGAV